ncbi:MAG: rhomboid family intramembrane serine protease GlpG [Colwellia sp.]
MTEQEHLSQAQQLQPLVQLNEHNTALLFANYLITINIEAKVVEVEEPQQKAFLVYCQQDEFSKAKTEFEAFIKQPYHAKYQQAAWQHGDAVQISSGGSSLLANFKENFFAHAGIVTLLVFALCWLIFLASNMGWARPIFAHLKFYSSLSFEGFLQQPIRLIGPAFFHFSWLHLVFNTMWWWQLGGSIEKKLGKGVLINLLLISAIFSNLGQFLISGANFGGLSGVVYALVGFVWWIGHLAPEEGISLPTPIIGFMLFWLVLGFVDLLPVNVANTAHLLGLISGCLLAVYKVKFSRNSS